MNQNIRLIIDLEGIVQGVGFRPAMLRLAANAGLAGWVQNRSGRVRLALEGPADAVKEFLLDLPSRIPSQARLDAIKELSREIIDGPAAPDFRILESDESEEVRVTIPADLASCHDCLREVMDPHDRRYAYPFTTCTLCGPRYTVVERMPYDRERTSLAAFPLCPDCRREYEDARNRRFHAESIACPVCGPRLFLRRPDGSSVPGDPMTKARAALAEGRIVAVRGLGGYLLAADAFNRKTLAQLRVRKARPHKPFAVMARDLAVARRYVDIPDDAADLMSGPISPIVILDIRSETNLPLDLLSPDAATLGLMLPTSPLHKLLFEPTHGDPTPPFDMLVMTSGNQRGEPIAIGNDEAFARLADIADLFLGHDREILLRNDDSLCVPVRGGTQVWRRARGYAPQAISIRNTFPYVVLAMGAELKNTVALGSGNEIVLSPHVGDLETPEALDGLEQVARRLPEFLDKRPEVVITDLHPDMRSTRLGDALAREWGARIVRVQHHRAHAVACLAENGEEAGLALVFDGTGLGTDGAIWGAELLAVTGPDWRRLASFAPSPLPGGDAAVRRPIRQAVARLWQAGARIDEERVAKLGANAEHAGVWIEQCRKGLNSPQTHAAGRVFDSFAAMLGLAPGEVTYEGQAAVRLEAAARRCPAGADLPNLPFDLVERGDLFLADWSVAFRVVASKDIPPDETPRWAMAFHCAIAEAATAMARRGSEITGLRAVALTGGVFMNRVLVDLLVPLLTAAGLRVLLHRRVPPNDGGIAFGQAALGAIGHFASESSADSADFAD